MIANAEIALQVCIGLALFLFGMHQLEAGVHTLGYATFRRWLMRSTASTAGSVGVGIGVTAVLQSSSMVSLLVLAFASAGVLPLVNAVGILLGANLGTTITGWMVATIGFKLSLQTLALPIMASGAVLQLLPRKKTRVGALGTLIFGFGLLIFGLDQMKTAVEGMATTWDMSVLRGQGLWLFFLAGAVLAALIQSSSATMMMTLAALHGGLFDLQSGAALIIGADLGTTSTTALGSIGGHHIKRQLALAHVIFNVVVDAGAFFVVLPLLPWALTALQLTDPLYSLVAFHSLFNVIGLAIFIPFLDRYSRWIGLRFTGSKEPPSALLGGVPATVPDAALIATTGQLRRLRAEATVLSLLSFDLSVTDLQLSAPPATEIRDAASRKIPLPERYQEIKRVESELLAFSMDLQAEPLTAGQVAQLNRQVAEARALVYSSKTLKDILHNLASMRDSALPAINDHYQFHRHYIRKFYEQFLELTRVSALADGGPAQPMGEALQSLLSQNDAQLRAGDALVRQLAASDSVTGSELSNLLNVNREVHHAMKSLIAQD